MRTLLLLLFSLSFLSAQEVTLPDHWTLDGRSNVIPHYEREVYGSLPAPELTTSIQELEAGTSVLDGQAIRRQVRLTRTNASGRSRTIDLLIYQPLGYGDRPHPTLVLLSFLGNQHLVPDSAIVMNPNPIYTSNAVERGIVDLHPTEAGRGNRQRRFPIELMIERGYAVVTAGYQDFLPDDNDAAREVIREFYGMDPAETGAISAWAAGYRTLVSYVLSQGYFPVGRVAAVGHSRLGKAVLWAAANDERIDAVCVNGSGCGGATLFQRRQGETIADITNNFPHWFRDRFHAWANRDEQLPFDQHYLLARIAPRPLLISAAVEDTWADPAGEFLALRAALPAYEELGATVSLPERFPAPGNTVGSGKVSFHLRAGQHDLIAPDWQAFLDLLKRNGWQD